MIQLYLKRMLRHLGFIKSSDESLGIQQNKVRTLYEKFLQFYNEEAKALEKKKFKDRLELWTGTGRYEVQFFRIVVELTEYNNQNILKRFWWRITNRIKEVDEKRTWLAYTLCQNLTNKGNFFDLEQLQVSYHELFPHRWKSILTQLKSAVAYLKSLLQGINQGSVIEDNWEGNKMLSDRYDELTHEENESTQRENSSIVLVSNASNDNVSSDSEITETDQLTLDQLYNLFYVCGFLNLPLEGVTPSQIKSRLNKLKLEVHPDKLPREYIDKNGETRPYSEEAFKRFQKMMSTCFEIVQSKMPPLPKHIDTPLLPTELLSQSEIDDVYSLGKDQANNFHDFLKFARSEAESNTMFQNFLINVAQYENSVSKYIKTADNYINHDDNYINNVTNYTNNANAYIEAMNQFIAQAEQTKSESKQLEKKVKELEDKFHNDASTEEKESAPPENSSIVLVSNASNNNVSSDSQITETDQLTLDQLYNLFYVCGFLNLPLEGVTPSQIKSRLNKLKLEVHPDKLPREYIDKNGDSRPYSEEAFKRFQEMMSTCFGIVQSKMPPLPKHIDTPLLPTELLSQSEIDDVYSLGKDQANNFYDFLKFARSEAESNTMYQNFLISCTKYENKVNNYLKRMENYLQHADDYIKNTDDHIKNTDTRIKDTDNRIKNKDNYINNISNYANNADVYIETVKQFMAQVEQTTAESKRLAKEAQELKDEFHNDANPAALSENPKAEAKTDRSSNILIYERLSGTVANDSDQPINTSFDDSTNRDSSSRPANDQSVIPEHAEVITPFQAIAENGLHPPKIDDESQAKRLTFQ